MNARETFSRGQIIAFLTAIGLIVIFLLLDYKLTIVLTLFTLTSLYLIHILLSFYISFKSIFYGEEIKIKDSELIDKNNYNWPTYTILCPLYREANIIEKFVSNMEALDYPKDKLECFLLLEEDDQETIDKAYSMQLPDYFKIIIVPDGYPKTKPKACNFGLNYATGKYLVIYDAEDRPEIHQLKKAVIAFARSMHSTVCVQAKLNFYNQNQNLLTNFFTCEYTLWFDLILPGFQSIGAPIPLGGTSNHFLSSTLKKLGGWDPFNVTEDCDLGIRLKSEGYNTVILDSTTWEEANSQLKNWIRQRSRWIKGYFQTFLVYTKNPLKTLRNLGLFNFAVFFLVTGFLPFASMINPFLWLTTILYFVFRAEIGPIIEGFYPGPILYMAVFSFIVGNFLYIYNYLVASAKKEHDSNLKFGLLMPFYWVFISVAAWYGGIQLLLKPHYWEKTKHGLLEKGINA